MKSKIKIINKEKNNQVTVSLSKEFYQKEAVFAAAYKFTDVCTIKIEPIDEYYVGVYLKSKKNVKMSIEKIAERLCNEALDQQVRLDLEKRFGNIRELIVEHAFSPIKNIKSKIAMER